MANSSNCRRRGIADSRVRGGACQGEGSEQQAGNGMVHDGTILADNCKLREMTRRPCSKVAPSGSCAHQTREKMAPLHRQTDPGGESDQRFLRTRSIRKVVTCSARSMLPAIVPSV